MLGVHPGAGVERHGHADSGRGAVESGADYFDGQTIERLDLAALGPHAPLPPGLSRLPGPGQYYASPALAALLRTVPRDELGDRYPGRLVGTIGDQALTGPDELVIFIGHKPAQLAAMGAQVVTHIATAPPKQVWTPYFRDAFVVGVLAVLFPMLILVGTATRLAAARREERYAAMRLVGATPRQISVVASIDAMVSALLGVLLGIGIFALVQPALANASLIGTRYFAFDVTPTATDYVGMLVGVPSCRPSRRCCRCAGCGSRRWAWPAGSRRRRPASGAWCRCSSGLACSSGAWP